MKGKIFIAITAMALWAAVLMAASFAPSSKTASCCPPTPGCPCSGICK